MSRVERNVTKLTCIAVYHGFNYTDLWQYEAHGWDLIQLSKEDDFMPQDER